MPANALGFRRRELLTAGSWALGSALAGGGAAAAQTLDLRLPHGPSQRALSRAFPQKGEMIVQRVRPPLLETPMSVFDQGVFTPNDRFFVRWHWAVIPTSINLETFRLDVKGAVTHPLSLSVQELLRMPRVEIAAVNQCSGNSRAYFGPAVPGAQWAHGAMGNAKWMGVSLRHLLDRAGVRPGAVAVRFSGRDEPVVPNGPKFAKSLALDHARDGEVMVAFAMNGQQLPLLNGFPLRLIVPGWFSTYWVKMLDTVEVLDRPDEGYWMAKAYKIPATPFANVAPGSAGFPTVPINRMVPRSWITNQVDGAKAAYGSVLPIRGLAMGGDQAVARVDLSIDGGRSWSPLQLGREEGCYGFRRFTGAVRLQQRGPLSLMTRCANTAGAVQQMTPNWNPGGFMRDCVETTQVMVS